MSTRRWSPEYGLGIPSIDAQHRALFRSLETLVHAIDEREDAGVIAALMTDLGRSVHDHFVDEEVLLDGARVIDLAQHKAEHRNVETSITHALTEHASGRPVHWRAVVQSVETRLLEHLTTRDTKLRVGVVQAGDCGGRVMIIDDSPTVVLQTTKRLEALGFSVTSRTVALGSTVAVMLTRPGFVLMDVEMPGIDGDALCRQITASTGVPVLLHSSVPRSRLQEVARACGASGFVCKTRDNDEFARELASACRRVCGGRSCVVPGISRLHGAK